MFVHIFTTPPSHHRRWLGGVAVGHWTRDQEVVGSTPTAALFGQQPWASCSHLMCLCSPSSITWYLARAFMLKAPCCWQRHRVQWTRGYCRAVLRWFTNCIEPQYKSSAFPFTVYTPIDFGMSECLSDVINYAKLQQSNRGPKITILHWLITLTTVYELTRYMWKKAMLLHCCEHKTILTKYYILYKYYVVAVILKDPSEDICKQSKARKWKVSTVGMCRCESEWVDS